MKIVKFSSNTSLLSKKSRLIGFCILNIQLELITDFVESVSQDTDTRTLAMSAMSTFLMIIHHNTEVVVREAELAEHHGRMP